MTEVELKSQSRFRSETEAANTASLLDRVSRSWPERAQVRRADPDPEIFDPALPDFLESLLPFGAHPGYTELPAELRQRILTCGWLIYNHKTIAIELDVITPACIDMMRDEVPGGFTWHAAPVISQTLVDEAYHTLLAVRVCKVTTQRRGIALDRPRFRLLAALERAMARRDPVGGRLVRLAFATVSELFVSDYLQLLSRADGIQPIHRESVAAHERDERAHRGLFPLLLREVACHLDPAQIRIFVDAAAEAVEAFGDCEYGAWAAALEQLAAPGRERLLAESRELKRSRMLDMDYSLLLRTLDDLGMRGDAYADDRVAGLVPPVR